MIFSGRSGCHFYLSKQVTVMLLLFSLFCGCFFNSPNSPLTLLPVASRPTQSQVKLCTCYHFPAQTLSTWSVCSTCFREMGGHWGKCVCPDMIVLADRAWKAKLFTDSGVGMHTMHKKSRKCGHAHQDNHANIMHPLQSKATQISNACDSTEILMNWVCVCVCLCGRVGVGRVGWGWKQSPNKAKQQKRQNNNKTASHAVHH